MELFPYNYTVNLIANKKINNELYLLFRCREFLLNKKDLHNYYYGKETWNKFKIPRIGGIIKNILGLIADKDKVFEQLYGIFENEPIINNNMKYVFSKKIINNSIYKMIGFIKNNITYIEYGGQWMNMDTKNITSTIPDTLYDLITYEKIEPYCKCSLTYCNKRVCNLDKILSILSFSTEDSKDSIQPINIVSINSTEDSKNSIQPINSTWLLTNKDEVPSTDDKFKDLNNSIQNLIGERCRYTYQATSLVYNTNIFESNDYYKLNFLKYKAHTTVRDIRSKYRSDKQNKSSNLGDQNIESCENIFKKECKGLSLNSITYYNTKFILDFPILKFLLFGFRADILNYDFANINNIIYKRILANGNPLQLINQLKDQPKQYINSLKIYYSHPESVSKIEYQSNKNVAVQKMIDHRIEVPNWFDLDCNIDYLPDLLYLLPDNFQDYKSFISKLHGHQRLGEVFDHIAINFKSYSEKQQNDIIEGFPEGPYRNTLKWILE